MEEIEAHGHILIFKKQLRTFPLFICKSMYVKIEKEYLEMKSFNVADEIVNWDLLLPVMKMLDKLIRARNFTYVLSRSFCKPIFTFFTPHQNDLPIYFTYIIRDRKNTQIFHFACLPKELEFYAIDVIRRFLIYRLRWIRRKKAIYFVLSHHKYYSSLK
jgi:hypothetical protein